jgi:hypothetical protein
LGKIKPQRNIRISSVDDRANICLGDMAKLLIVSSHISKTKLNNNTLTL